VLGLAALASLAACGDSTASPAPTLDPNAPPPTTIPVTLTDAGCSPQDFTLKPGTVVFAVTNPGSTKVKEMEIQDAAGHVRGDVEGVGVGTTRSLIIELKPGTYRVRCPEDAATGGTITVG